MTGRFRQSKRMQNSKQWKTYIEKKSGAADDMRHSILL